MDERLAKERAETDALKREALQLGVEIPRGRGWWWEDVESFSGSSHEWEFVREEFEYLTEIGKAGTKRAIQDERARLREVQAAITDRRIRWTCQIIAAITGLAGAAIGLLAIILAMRKK